MPGHEHDKFPIPGKQPDKNPIEEYRKEKEKERKPPNFKEDDLKEYEEVPEEIIDQEQQQGQ